jgi:hypothetical protein
MGVEFGMITSVVMPGGWHYPQTLSSGQEIRITAPSFEMLLESILEFRRRHMDLCGAENAEIGKVRRDLKDYICKNFRQNCADSRPAPANNIGIGISLVADYITPIDKAGNWLSEIEHHRLEHVDLGIAGYRAQICAQCPMNVRWQTGCAPCNENIEIRIQNLKGNMRTPYDPQLHLCRVFGHVNSVAIWLAETRSSSEGKVPPHCWMTKGDSYGQ